MIQLKGFESYYGGKGAAGIPQKIINLIPPHDVFISACLGACRVLRTIKPAESSFGIDPNKEIIEAWNNAEKDREIELYQEDCYKVLRLFNFDLFKKYVLYYDPPYIIESRKTPKKVYKHEFDIEHHQKTTALLGFLSRTYSNIYIIVHHYPHPLYDTTFKDWNTVDFMNNTRQGQALERIYMNFPTPEELHDYRFVGENYRDRENIAKLKSNWELHFATMAPAERKAILIAMKEHPYHLDEKVYMQGYVGKLTEKDPRVRNALIRHLWDYFKLEEVPA